MAPRRILALGMPLLDHYKHSYICALPHPPRRATYKLSVIVNFAFLSTWCDEDIFFGEFRVVSFYSFSVRLKVNKMMLNTNTMRL